MLTFKEIPADTSQATRQGIVEYSRKFQIFTSATVAPIRSSAKMRILVEQLRPDLRPFATHPDDTLAFVTTPVLNRISRYLWELSVPYSSDVNAEELEFKNNSTASGNGDRTQLGTRIRVTTSQRQELLATDIQGKPFLNTAGDAILGIEADRSRLEIAVESDVRSVNPSVWEYRDSINNAAVRVKTPQITRTFPRQTLRVMEITASEMKSSGTVQYTTLTMRLQEKIDGWNHRELNLGLRERINTARTAFLTPILDESGVPISEPVFLDKKGRAYRVGLEANKEEVDASAIRGKELRTDLADREIIILEFDIYSERPFGQLTI